MNRVRVGDRVRDRDRVWVRVTVSTRLKNNSGELMDKYLHVFLKHFIA